MVLHKAHREALTIGAFTLSELRAFFGSFVGFFFVCLMSYVLSLLILRRAYMTIINVFFRLKAYIYTAFNLATASLQTLII